MSKVISVLHHSLRCPSDCEIAEEDNLGWHFRSARAIADKIDADVECVRPSTSEKWIEKVLDGVRIKLAPALRPPVPDKLWKWREVSLPMINYLKREAKEDEVLFYIHGYRALNSRLLVREISDKAPIILQHHGTRPSAYEFKRLIRNLKIFKAARRIPSFLGEASLKGIDGLAFVLNEREKRYLKRLGAGATVKLRPMGVSFEKIDPPSWKEKRKLRRELGLKRKSTILTSYVGVHREKFTPLKGAPHVKKICTSLENRLEDLQMVVTGIEGKEPEDREKKNCKFYEFLPHEKFIDLIRASDVFFLPSPSSYYYGGVGVAAMEAMAAGVPVVSPTLRHFPDPDNLGTLGRCPPWVDSERDLEKFIEILGAVAEKRKRFVPEEIRRIAGKFYSWKSFQLDFARALESTVAMEVNLANLKNSARIGDD